MGAYTEDDIFTPERLEVVRMSPTEFFNSTGIEGLVHQAAEIIANGIDEIALMPELAGKLMVLLCVDVEHNTYQIVVKDTGRGLPIGKLLDSYTKIHTSGKFKQSAYEVSGGQFGIGAKASAGTSQDFRAITRCDDEVIDRVVRTPAGSASIRVHEGQTDEVVERLNVPPAQTGVTVIFQPDPTVFTDIPMFSDVGQAQLHLLLQKYCWFRRLNIEFRVHPLGLPASIWTDPIPAAEATVERYLQAANLVFSEATFDRLSWIRDYWGVRRPFSLQYTLSDTFFATVADPKPRENVRIRYDVRLYSAKFDTVGGHFGMVNNVPIDDVKSTHFLTVTDVLKKAMSGYIKEAAVQKFFLEQYRVPCYLAVDIKFPGAKLSGTTKHAFISRPFRSVYEPSLQQQLATPEGAAFVEGLYQQLADDIASRYTIEMTGAAPVKNYNRLFEQFDGLSDHYKDCSTTNRQAAELFLVEGQSAGAAADKGRDRVTQGYYLLRGKPFNGVRHRDAVLQSANAIRDNRIYKEILAVTGINPAKFDPNALNFGKLIIMSDADDHGYHIAALLVGNFYTLCPDIINSGILYAGMPPLYSLKYTGKKNTPLIYFRDKEAMQLWLIENVYLRYLDVGVRIRGTGDKTFFLPPTECVRFLQAVLAIGEAITNLAAELVLDEMVVERLTHVTAALETVDIARLKQIPDVDRVDYEPNGNILVLTIGKDDHIVPLQNVWKRLVEVVLPKLNRIQWRKTEIHITTKNSTDYRDTPVSIMKLNAILQALDGMFIPERYKGLGSMMPEDMGPTCMDPARRSLRQITSVGDVDVIFQLLGDESIARKKLLSRD